MTRLIFLGSFITVLLLGAQGLIAQESDSLRQAKKEKKGIVFEKEFSIDLRLHTNGWAVAGNYGKIETYKRTQLFQVEIGEIKHPKEIRQSFDFATSGTNVASSFVYGKQNNFYQINASYGYKHYFSEKAKRRGVAVGMTYMGGFSLGILKPYYLELIELDPNGGGYTTTPRKYTEETAEDFLNTGLIFGGGGVLRGFTEIKPRPGLHAKAGLHLDWGAYDQFVKAIDVGVMVNGYFSKIPIMILEENRPVFVNFYLTIELGRRW